MYADLLTYSDLEMLRSRQSRKATTSAPAVSKPNNKRYLILTYHVEYDRVHYPLPLTHVEDPPSKALKETIKRLRSELDVARSSGTSTLRASGGDADELRRQIADLKVQLRRVGQRDGGGPSTDEFDAVVRERDDARRDADAHRAKAAQLARENDRLDAELQRDRAQHEDRGEREAHARAMREARRNLTELENDLANEREEARQEQAELRHQIVALTRQNDAAQQQILDLKGQVIDLKQDVEVAKRRSRIEADCSTDPRLESRRQIYGSSPSSRPGSRPASAERRRPSPQPSRPFQRFDPTAYVKDKQASVRGRSVSPRPGVPNPSSRPASAPSSRGSSRPSSAERGGGRPAWGSNSAGGRSPASNVSGGAAGGRDVRPFSRERDRPWAQPPMSIQERRAQAEQARRRPASAERARPGGGGGGTRISPAPGGGTRSGSAERARPWGSGGAGMAAVASGRAGGSLSRPPVSPRTGWSAGEKGGHGEGARASPGGAGSRAGLSPGGNSTRVNGRAGGRGVASSASEGEENCRPQGGGNQGESEDISDIDARLNALQNFLRAAKEKAKAASTSRSVRA